MKGEEKLTLIVEYHGGPSDGTVVEDALSEPPPEISPDKKEIDRFNARLAWGMTNGEVGKVFMTFSEATLERQMVQKLTGILLHEYKLVDRLDGEGEVLLKCEYTGTHTYDLTKRPEGL